MAKKIISLVLLLVMLILPIDFADADEAATSNISMDELTNSEEYKLLSKIGVVNEEDAVSNAFSRQQFVDIASKLVNIKPTTERVYYVDVAAGNIANTFAEMKYLMPGEDRLFRPNDSITYQEAYIIIVRLLGYEPYATARGGLPVEYKKIAQQSGILLNKESEDKMYFADVVQMLYRALNASVYEGVRYGTDIEYANTMTLAEKIYDITCVRGVLQANEWISVYKNVSCPGDDRITVNQETYRTETREIAESMLLGRNVKLYLQKDSKKNDLVAILLIPDENDDVYSFTYNDISRATDYSIELYKESKRKTIALQNPILIYNGDVDFEKGIYDILDVVKEKRTETTVVKGADNDIVIVNSLTNAKVTSVDSKTGYIYAKDAADNAYRIPGKAVGVVDRIKILDLSYGVEETIDDIKIGDFISFGISNSGRVVNIYHCTKIIRGKVKQIQIQEQENYITIEDETYPADKDFLGGTPSLWTSAIFYIGYFGELIGMADADEAWRTGYLYQIGNGQDIFGKRKYLFNIYTSEKTIQEFQCADKYILDGSERKSDSDFVERVSPGGVIDDRLRLFRYKINNKGELLHIDTAALLEEIPESEESLRILGERLERSYIKDTASGYMAFNAEVKKVNGKYIPLSGENRAYAYPLNRNTEIFTVPIDNTTEALERNFDYSTIEKTSNLTTGNIKNMVAMYNTNIHSDYIDKVVLYRNPEMPYNARSIPYLINEVGIESLYEDEVCKGIEVITTMAMNAETKSILLNSEVEFVNVRGEKNTLTDTQVIAELSSGDIVQCGSTVTGKVNSVRVIYDYDADDPDTTDDDNRGQVYWGWTDEYGNPRTTYSYRFSSDDEKTDIATDFRGCYGYLLDRVVHIDMSNIKDSYGETVSSSYAFLGALGTEGSNKVHGSANWVVPYYRLTAYDASRRNNRAYWAIYTDMVDYQSSQTDYNLVIIMTGSIMRLGQCAVFYKR